MQIIINISEDELQNEEIAEQIELIKLDPHAEVIEQPKEYKEVMEKFKSLFPETWERIKLGDPEIVRRYAMMTMREPNYDVYCERCGKQIDEYVYYKSYHDPTYCFDCMYEISDKDENDEVDEEWEYELVNNYAYNVEVVAYEAYCDRKVDEALGK